MKTFKALCLAFLVAACFLPLKAYAIDDAILAVVNDEIITLKDLQEYMKGVFSQLRIEGKSPEEINEIMAQYENKGINQLIDDRLILAAAEKAGIMIKPKAIDDRFEEIKKNYSSYQDFITAINKEGLTISDVRKKIENQYKGQVVVDQEVRKKIYVNPQEVTDYFNSHAEEYRTEPMVFLQSVFVQKNNNSDEARLKAEKALKEIKTGIDFKEVNAKYSDLPSVGRMKQDDIRGELRDTVLALKIGDVSDIIEVSDGFYIFKMEGRTNGFSSALKDVKAQIYQQLFEQKFRVRFKEWIDSLRKKAYVEIKQ